MSMNKKFFKILIILIVFISILGINVNKINASTTTININCTSFTTKNQCQAFTKCRWMSGSCQFQNVAAEPCNDYNIRKVLKIFGYILLLAKVIIPLLIIGFGTFDIYKSVIDKDEKSLGKQVKRLGIRVVTGIMVFFIPNFIYAIFSLSDKLNIIETEQYNTCATCLLDPTNNEICALEEN